MSAASKIMEEAKSQIRALQQRCSHEEWTDWFRPMWAPGHYYLYEVRICKRCDKEMDRRNFKLTDPNLEETPT